MASLFVHIGLPKTGTTTLQKHYFSKLKDFQYQGVFQPRRSRKAGEVYQGAISVFNQEVSDYDIIENANKLNKKYGSEKILISEEMFCVGVNWKEKLRRLALFLREFDDYQIITSIREPVKASFSFYVEAYESLSKGGKNSYIQTITNSQHMIIYHYDQFFLDLKYFFGEKKIFIIRFEDIFIYNKLEKLSRIFGESMQIVDLKNENKKNKFAGFVITNKGNKVLLLTAEEETMAKEVLKSHHYDRLPDYL